jgi:hypothetical protein
MALTATSPAPAAPPAAKDPAEAAGAGPDLEGELGQLEDLAQQNQANIDKISKDNALVRQKIAALKAGLGEVVQTVKAYTQSSKLIADQSSLQSFVDKQMDIAVAAVGPNKTALDGIVTRVDADIQTQAKLTTDLQSSSDNAAAAQTAALNTATEKQAAYDFAKTTQSRAQAALSDLNVLKNQASSAAGSGNFALMYATLLEMKGVLSSLVAPSPGDLQAQLYTALSDLHATLNDASDKKQASDAAAADLAAAQKKLNELKLSRRDSVLNAAKNLKVPPPANAEE